VRAVIAQREKAPFESLDDLQTLPIAEGPLAEISAARGSVQGLDAKASITSGQTDWFGTFSQILMLLGMIAALIYFYFSIAHKGVVGRVSKFGVWILMIGFGASFGYTVQGRISLAIGRALDVLGRDKDPSDAAQIHGPLVGLISILFIVVGLVLWEAKIRKNQDDGDGGATQSASD
jgi:hypothetical protein